MKEKDAEVKNLLNRKGMSMAMEIFIVLFVLLAVAMLVLRMVTEQTESQIKVLGEEQKKAELKQLKADCASACKCDSLRSKVGYCLKLIESQTYGKGQMDFTENGFAADFAEPAESGGLYGLCEDKVFCSQINSCMCGNQELSMKNCFRLICQLWTSEGAPIGEMMNRFFPEPACTMTEDQEAVHWRFVYAQDMTCGG